MLPAVKGDEAELQNVFLNLFINARDAMDGNGTLRVSTSKYDERPYLYSNRGYGKRH